MADSFSISGDCQPDSVDIRLLTCAGVCFPDTTVRFTTGSRLGPYEIRSVIDQGGMGEVYRACDTRLDRTVAIKVLTSARSHDRTTRLRFEREAKALSNLRHPHICALYDV